MPPLILLVPAAVLAILLRPELVYPVYHANDMVSHLAYARLLLSAFRKGSLGLEAWYGQDSFGLPIFRTYQNFSHYLLAGLCRLFGTEDVAWMAHALIVLTIVLQPFVFHHAARRCGLSARASLFAGIVAPLVSSYRIAGHELRSYVFAGYGLLPQALGVTCLVMALGAVTASVRRPRESAWRDGAECGLWLALTFLFHHFFGYMALLYYGAVSLLALAGRWQPVGEAIRRTSIAAGVFLAGCAYQLLSILQDRPLMHQNFHMRAERWNGFGIAKVFSELGRGALLDYRRWPVLGLLAALGLVAALRPRAARGERALLLLLGLGIFFFAGRTSFPWIDWLPGMSNLHLERFLVLIHLAAIFLAAIGAAAVWRLPKAGPVLVVAALGYLWWNAIEYLRFDGRLLAETSAVHRTLDRGLFSAARPFLGQGNLWAFRPEQPEIPALGITPYYAIATELGYSQVSHAEQMMTYATEAVPRLDPYNRALSRMFNLAVVIAPRQFVPPLFAFVVHRNDELQTWVDPRAGLWGVITIGATEVIDREDVYQRRIAGWLSDPRLDEGRLPAYVPAAIARRWPSAVPKPSTPGAELGASVAESQPIDGNHSRAVLESPNTGAYGILRVAYHPRWSIRVNGVARAPLWVSPGMVAFPLEQGRNEVEVEFPEDPLRGMLFMLGGLTLVCAAAFVAFAARFRIALPNQQPQTA